MSNSTSLNPVHVSKVTTRGVAVSSRFTSFWQTMIGKKVVMAVTGVVLIGFVIGHMIGNLKIFAGPNEIDTYARFLREAGTPELSNGQLLWVVRFVLLACVAFHITAAVQLSRMSWAARPVGYQVKRNIETTFAARMMRWGGVLLAAFIIFHLLHLTGGVVGFQPGQFRDLAVYQNVLAAFSVWPVAIFYVIAMAALGLHLSHGIWSMMQTLDWNTARNDEKLRVLSRLIAIVVFVGFTSVPVAVMAGWLH